MLVIWGEGAAAHAGNPHQPAFHLRPVLLGGNQEALLGLAAVGSPCRPSPSAMSAHLNPQGIVNMAAAAAAVRHRQQQMSPSFCCLMVSQLFLPSPMRFHE